jgi:hypothetical protein
MTEEMNMNNAHDIFWFVDWTKFSADAPEVIWLINQRLKPHLLGFGFSEGAD